MKRNKITILFIAVLICLGMFLTGSLRAEEKDQKPALTGSFSLGYRFVDFGDNSSETKYKEDINLEKGPRLFNFKIQYNPEGILAKYVDSLEIKASNLGDNFEVIGIEANKYGKYRFSYERKKSNYFYADNLKGGDYHTFNFDRIHDEGLLKFWLGKCAHFYMSFDRFTKKGESTISQDVERTEFEMDKRIDEKSQEFTFGLDYSSKIFGIVIEDKILEYDNTNSYFLPGYADGGDNASYPSSLLYYRMNQPYDAKGNIFNTKMSFRPFKSLLIRGSAQVVKQDVDILYSEEAEGTDYMGEYFKYAYSGSGRFETKIYTYDTDWTYLLSNKLAVVGSLRYDKFNQKKGEFTIGTTTEDLFLKYETGSFEGGVQYQLSSKLGLTMGYRKEKRDIKTPEGEETSEDMNLTTDREGFFGNMKWDLTKALSFGFDFQSGTYDHSYTLISPSSFKRYKTMLKFKKNAFYTNLSYLYTKSTSDMEDQAWESVNKQFSGRMGYHGTTIMAWLGYNTINVTREGTRVIYYPPGWSGPDGTFTWDIMFEGKSKLFDMFLSYNFTKKLAVGGYFQSYKNTGSWELKRSIFKAFLKVETPCGILGELGYRLVDFKESQLGLNNYKANIFEISMGYRW